MDQGIADSNPEPLFVAAAAAFSAIGIAHLELLELPLDRTFGRSEPRRFVIHAIHWVDFQGGPPALLWNRFRHELRVNK